MCLLPSTPKRYQLLSPHMARINIKSCLSAWKILKPLSSEWGIIVCTTCLTSQLILMTVIYNESWADHKISFCEVFNRLWQANISVNLAKSDFGKGEVTYLGHRIGYGKLSPVDAKIYGILDVLARPMWKAYDDFWVWEDITGNFVVILQMLLHPHPVIS